MALHFQIQIQHIINRLDPRSMRVAGNDHVNSANCWINPQFLKVVQDIERSLSELYRLSVRIMFRPVGGIDVPSDRSDRRNPTESDNIRATNIASVDDMRHPPQALPQPRAAGARGCPRQFQFAALQHPSMRAERAWLNLRRIKNEKYICSIQDCPVNTWSCPLTT